MNDIIAVDGQWFMRDPSGTWHLSPPARPLPPRLRRRHRRRPQKIAAKRHFPVRENRQFLRNLPPPPR